MEVEIEGALQTSESIQSGKSHPQPLGAGRLRRTSTAQSTAAANHRAGERRPLKASAQMPPAYPRPPPDPRSLI